MTTTDPLDLLELAELVARASTTRGTSRDAIAQAADTTPAEAVRAIPVQRLVADAPTLPPLGQRSITGTLIDALLAAGAGAAIVQTARGVRVAHLDDRLAADPTVIVLTDHAEAHAATAQRTLGDGTTVPGARSVDFARDVLAREQDAYDYATTAA